MVKVLKHGRENVTTLNQSLVEETAVIKENLLSTDNVPTILALVNILFLYTVNLRIKTKKYKPKALC